MKFVYVLEDDEKLQQEIVAAIQSIEPRIQIRLFSSVELFVLWIKDMMQRGPESVATGGIAPQWLEGEAIPNEEHQLVLIVSKIEFLGPKQIPLMVKTRDQFIKRKICTAEDPTAFVLTTFGEPEFKIKDLKDRLLNNVIYKPFDRLILTQHLTYAISGRHPPSKYTVANQKTTAVVEMLKAAQLVAISDVGFVTRSDRLLEKKGVISKYYGGIFSAGTKVSLMGSVLESFPDPHNPQQFICSFSYFGISSEQLLAIRKKLKTINETYEYHWENSLKDPRRLNRSIGVVIIDEQEKNSIETEEWLQRKFSQLKVVRYANYVDFLLELDPKMAEDKDSKQVIRALPQDLEISFIFDPKGIQVLEFAKSAEKPMLVFNVTEEKVKEALFWKTALGSDMLTRWSAWVAAPSDKVISLFSGGRRFYIKPMSLERDPQSNRLKVKFEELSLEQRNQYLISNSKLPEVTDLMLVSSSFLQADAAEKWQNIRGALKKRAERVHPELSTKIGLLANQEYTDTEARDLGNFVNDVYFRPLDRAYLASKLKLFVPELQYTDKESGFLTGTHFEEINVANPVSISEISEAGLVMQYYRKISLGSFRSFVLWTMNEANAPKLIGNCNFSEESSQKGVFNNHFVFYGITDLFLKAIRVWIRENYVHSKEKG